jgi:hypothetical protein
MIEKLNQYMRDLREMFDYLEKIKTKVDEHFPETIKEPADMAQGCITDAAVKMSEIVGLEANFVNYYGTSLTECPYSKKGGNK